ncbi:MULTISPECIES: radical SAM protein [unclassified Streptomyces]|uniref:radical SAM protein n=1 Tax=unclassified Streptomyces TaxID=2593676 RepID=UPI000DACAEDE|nr:MULTISPECIES: radical SAM protein [unclassified Streptomyces]PZT75156.1 radical SAM protein [Streptomyces sp. AC1-42T]PZT81861.1 radical SAM protein [Streptomyces sp. AC1-42W]
MTTFVERNAHEAVANIQSLELEITGKCQLSCTHCLSESSPQATHGTISVDDWRAVITDAAALDIRTIQIIGGEPTAHPNWQALAEHALTLGRHVEVYSNLYKVQEQWWELFTHPSVTLGTSYYSDVPREHDAITGRRGSYARTRSNILEAVKRGVPIRAGIVEVLPGQHVAGAREELLSMGVTRISMDRARAVGRALPPGQSPTLDEMCGRCTRGRAAVLPNGNLVGCVLARDFPAGNVRESRLAELLGGKTWAELAARIPLPARSACPPDDSSDCNPANTTACGPKY